MYYDEADMKIITIFAFIVGLIIGAIFAFNLYTDLRPKYCPECGRNYRSAYEYCSNDGTPLKDRESRAEKHRGEE